jgi:hypothetical protein
VASSRRERHRDRDPGARTFEAPVGPSPNRVFTITDVQRQQIAKALRAIDDAAHAVAKQQNPENRTILRELTAAADRIFEIIDALDEIDDDPPRSA